MRSNFRFLMKDDLITGQVVFRNWLGNRYLAGVEPYN